MRRINEIIETPMKSLQTFIFNMKEKLYHHRLGEEIALIKNTNLFTTMSEAGFKKMLNSVRLVRYQKDSVILHEGEPGNVLFIITEGCVRVYTQDMSGKKIPLKKLVKGDYFGEQAISSKTVKVRNSNVEAATDATLIQINGKFISQLLRNDSSLTARFESDKYKQALNIMSLSSGFHQDIESILTKIDHPTILEFTNNQYIFKVGDKPDHVYIVLQGKVKLLVPNNQTGAFTKVLLNRGHIFGELGVIKDAPRSATAIAHSNLRLLAIQGDYFKNDVSKTPKFQEMLSTLQQIYEIPMRGTIEQYVGDLPGKGSAITNIYKLDDGRLIVSSKVLNKALFTMSIANVLSERKYIYKSGENTIELSVNAHHLIGIEAYGTWSILPELCRILMDNEPLQDTAFKLFELTGELRG